MSYYVDGVLIKKINRFTGVSETDQSFSLFLDINQTLDIGETQGFRTIFAIAEDSSGNFVSSQIHNLSFTQGSNPPAISVTRGFNGFHLTAPGDLNITRFDLVRLPPWCLPQRPVGKNLVDAKIIVSGTGTGVEIKPIINLDPLSPDYGKLTDFNVTNGGSGYSSNLEFSVIRWCVPLMKVSVLSWITFITHPMMPMPRLGQIRSGPQPIQMDHSSWVVVMWFHLGL